jgi:hypothetical protein
MIHVQLDVTDPDEPTETTAVWSGWWEQAPAVGHTIQLRPDRRTDPEHYYRVTGVDWIVWGHAQASVSFSAPVNVAVVTVEEYRPGKEQAA